MKRSDAALLGVCEQSFGVSTISALPCRGPKGSPDWATQDIAQLLFQEVTALLFGRLEAEVIVHDGVHLSA